jgi:hypothetical protein
MRLAYEALLEARDFNNPGRTLAIVRNMLGALRKQTGEVHGEFQLSILLKQDDAKDQNHDRAPPAQIETD